MINLLRKPLKKKARVRVLFVCMGNLCRSPTAQAVLEKLARDAGLEGLVNADSAGTRAYYKGEPPDQRAQAAAVRRGYDLSGQRARRATESDFEHFDYVLAMDHDTLAHLTEICPPGEESKLRLLMEYAATRRQAEVPDPYFGNRG